jgi:hypothetical protein
MDAVRTVEAIIKAGLITKSAFERARAADRKVDWKKFVQSADFAAAQESVSEVLKQLTKKDVTSAVQRIRKKQKDFLRGRKISELSIDELLQFGQLADAESILVREEMKQLGASPKFLGWLIDDALPVLVKVAKVVIPIIV